MGQQGSRQSYQSTSSQAALTGIWSEKPPSASSPQSNISRPARPREITRLSVLIDPEEVKSDWKIRSPSGNLLGPNGFFSHPARPLSVRERQERVRAAMEGQRKESFGSRIVPMEALGREVSVQDRKSEKRSRLCCFWG